MVDFSRLKKNRGNIDTLKRAMEEQNAANNAADDASYWKLERDKAGNGFAVIRFLPAPPADGEDALPWVKYYSHGFEVNGKWYIENSLTTPRPSAPQGDPDPVSESNSLLWNSGRERDKDIARARKRKLSYVSNIYVVSDPKNPENEGKVFKFRYGKKIFDMIQTAMHPEFEDEKPMNPFDLWEGANFKLKARVVDKQVTYDKSGFDTPSALLDDDAKLEKIWKSEYSLQELLSDKYFKSYDELKRRFEQVVGGGAPASKTAENTDTTEADAQPAQRQRRQRPAQEEDTPPWEDAPARSKPAAKAEAEDEDLAFFRGLASKG